MESKQHDHHEQKNAQCKVVWHAATITVEEEERRQKHRAEGYSGLVGVGRPLYNDHDDDYNDDDSHHNSS